MCNVLEKNEHHIWKDQSLFFYLHITCYYKYVIGLQLLQLNKALHKCYAAILHYSFIHLHPRIITLFNVKICKQESISEMFMFEVKISNSFRIHG
jgi:hypothetical protein